MLIKTNKYIFLLFLVYPCVCNSLPKHDVTSCNNSNSTNNLLIGTWVNENIERKLSYTYNKNKKYTGYFILKKVNEVWVFSASWKLEGNIISYTYDYIKTANSNKKLKEGALDSDSIESLNCKELIIQTREGNKRKFIRK